MKVKATEQIRFTMNKHRYRIEVGETYTLPDDVGTFLVERGFAKEVKPRKAAPKKETKDS